MPTYDYECGACKGHFEVFHPMKETRKKCPRCGASRLTRLIGPGAGFLFKGSGFYITDHRSSDYSSRAKAESEGGKPASSTPEKGGEKAGNEKAGKEKKEPVKPLRGSRASDSPAG